MATQSVTTEALFRPQEGRCIMRVNRGFDSSIAAGDASSLEDAVRELLSSSVEKGMSGATAYLCEFVLEAAKALRDAAGQEI